MYSFMSGKSYELYMQMLTQLKTIAMELGLTLSPKVIHCDFEKGAIKAFQMAFPGVKVSGCHFHFTSAIYKEIGLKALYSGESSNKEFRTWVRMLMAFPFLMLDDIDEVWDEIVENKPDLGVNNFKVILMLDNGNVIKYF